MEKKIGSALMLMVVMVLGIFGQATAGVDPQPFRAEINKLGAVVNNLVEVRIRLNVALAHPPDPGRGGAEGQFDAMAIQLGVLYNRVNGVLHPPEPGTPLPDDDRVLNALRTVHDQAAGIVSDIRKNPPPDDDRVFDGLKRVFDGAQAIVDLADQFIGKGTTIVGGE